MQRVLHCTSHGQACMASRSGHRPAPMAISLGAVAPARGCQLGCGVSAHSSLRSRSGRAAGRLGRRGAVVCRVAAKNFYELLGVPQSASARDIKAAYRKLAMKLHPDVNRAPDAQQRFTEVKVAYETLSDAKQRAEYDRRLRMGYSGASSGGSRAGSSGTGFGGASSSGGWGPYGPYGTGPGYSAEPVPGLDDLVRELEKEFTAWANSRGQGARAKSLMEELEDLGGELLDFLEDALGIKDEQPAPGPSGGARAAAGGAQAGAGSAPRSAAGATTGTAGGYREPRSAAEKFDALWEQFGDGAPQRAGAGAAAGGGGSSTARASPGSGRTAGGGGGSGTGGAGAGAGSTAGGRAASTSTTSSSSSSGAQRPPPRSSEDDIDAQLLALKKKLNKL